MKIGRDTGIYAMLHHSGSVIGICRAKSGAHIYETKFKTAQSVLQAYLGFSGTVCEQRTAILFLLHCTKWVSLAQQSRRAQWRMLKYGRRSKRQRRYLRDRKVTSRG